MNVASVVLTHGHPELTADTVDAIETWAGNRVLVLVDQAGWGKFENTRIGSAKVEQGFYHAFNRNVYRNSVLAVKKAYEHWPDSDWFLYTEYDCLFTSDAFKAELAEADRRNAWCVGFDLRRFDFQMPYFQRLLNQGPIRHSYYLLGACYFLSRQLVAKLHDIGFYDRLLEGTRDFVKGFYPEYPRWSFEEELWATAAVQLGGSLYELACWKLLDRQWHPRYTDDPHVIYAPGEHPQWRGSFPVYPVRFTPDVAPQEISSNTSIVHPLKDLNNPVRVSQRSHREGVRRMRALMPSSVIVSP